MNKRITLTLVLIMNLAWVLAQTSGTFGALTWSYADKQLTISGQGEMINASVPEDYPWRKYCDEIEKIVVEPGVTTIGSYAFDWCWKATVCSLPEGDNRHLQVCVLRLQQSQGVQDTQHRARNR